MNKRMNKNVSKKSGFSMLELVVFMLIMGTLAGIAISKMGGSDSGAIKAGVKSDLRGAIAQTNACYADKLDYTRCTGLAYPKSPNTVDLIMSGTTKRELGTLCASARVRDGTTEDYSMTYNGSTGLFAEGTASCD